MDDPTYTELAERIRSGDRNTMIQAAHQLGDSGDPQGVPTLMSLLMNTNDPDVRNAAAVGLRELGDSRAVPLLAELLRDPKTKGNRSTLVYALQGLDCRPILPQLIDLVIEDNWEVSREAMHAIESTTGKIPNAVFDECVRKIEKALPEATGDKRVMLGDLHDLFSKAE